jgi:hypothetical protein
MRFQRQQDVPSVRLGQAISNYFLDGRLPADGTASPSRGSLEFFSLPPPLERTLCPSITSALLRLYDRTKCNRSASCRTSSLVRRVHLQRRKGTARRKWRVRDRRNRVGPRRGYRGELKKTVTRTKRTTRVPRIKSEQASRSVNARF